MCWASDRHSKQSDFGIISEVPVPAALFLTDLVLGLAIFATLNGIGRWLAVHERCSPDLAQSGRQTRRRSLSLGAIPVKAFIGSSMAFVRAVGLIRGERSTGMYWLELTAHSAGH